MTIPKKSYRRLFKYNRWRLNFVFPCSFSHNGVCFLHSTLGDEPARRLRDEPAEFAFQLKLTNGAGELSSFNSHHAGRLTTTGGGRWQRSWTELQAGSSILWCHMQSRVRSCSRCSRKEMHRELWRPPAWSCLAALFLHERGHKTREAINNQTHGSLSESYPRLMNGWEMANKPYLTRKQIYKWISVKLQQRGTWCRTSSMSKRKTEGGQQHTGQQVRWKRHSFYQIWKKRRKRQ